MLPVVCQNIWQKKSFSHSNYFQDVRAFHRRTAKRQQWDQIVLLLKGRIKYYNPFMWLSNENRLVSACKDRFRAQYCCWKVSKASEERNNKLDLYVKEKPNLISKSIQIICEVLFTILVILKQLYKKQWQEKNSLRCLRRWTNIYSHIMLLLVYSLIEYECKDNQNPCKMQIFV